MCEGLRGLLAQAARLHPCGGGPPPCPGLVCAPLSRWDGYAPLVPSDDLSPEPPAAPTPSATPSRRAVVRAARTSDVRAIRALVAPQAERRVLLNKEAVAYYESVSDFVVAEIDGAVVGCGALHVLWEDLGEVRTLVVAESALGSGVGSAVLRRLIERARELGLSRLFCLTFETEFFARHGFEVIEGQAVDPEVYAELLRSYDEGVAEFLDLERVKPNTLGNTRMLRQL